MTFSPCGDSPRRSAKRRRAPAQVASTTSLGVTPKRRRSVRRSSSDRVTRTWWRRGEPGRLSGSRARAAAAVCDSVRAPRLASPGRPRQRAGDPAIRTGARTRAAPSAARSATARASRVARARARGRRPAPRPPARCRGVGLGVEDQVAELDHGHPVDHAVVHLPDHREAPVRQLVGDPHLPQRAVARERGGEDRVGELVEVVALGVQEVVGGVEAGIVDPHRLVQPERHRGELLPVAGRVREPPGEVVEELVETGARPALRRVEGGHPADVHRRGRALDREERGVERGQALGAHVPPSSSGCQWSCVSRARLGRPRRTR